MKWLDQKLCGNQSNQEIRQQYFQLLARKISAAFVLVGKTIIDIVLIVVSVPVVSNVIVMIAIVIVMIVIVIVGGDSHHHISASWLQKGLAERCHQSILAALSS